MFVPSRYGKMGCCCGKGSSDHDTDAVVEMENVTNEAVLCRIGRKGDRIRVLEEGKRYEVSGKGTVLGSSILDCDIGYWEVEVGDNPKGCRVGIKRYNHKKGPVSLDGGLEAGEKVPSCWILEPKDLDEEIKKGQVIGIHWDQSDFPMVSFTIDGRLHSKASITRVRPTNDLYPAISIDDGSTAHIAFHEDAFQRKPWASKFRMIVSATNIM